MEAILIAQNAAAIISAALQAASVAKSVYDGIKASLTPEEQSALDAQIADADAARQASWATADTALSDAATKS